MVNSVKIRRGNKANLPATGSDGEFLYAKDTNELFIGNGTSVVRVNDGVIGTATQTALNGKVSGLNGTTGLWKGTAAQYAALTPDANVVYVVQG